MNKVVIALIINFSLVLSATAQNNDAQHFTESQSIEKTMHSVKIDFGIGLGVVENSGGISGRFAVGFNTQKWCGTIRSIMAPGEKGKKIHGLFSDGYVKEHFYETAVLLDRVLKPYNGSQLTAGIGIGLVRGNRLNASGSSEIDFDNVYGFAYEVAWVTTGSTVGFSSQLYGNINKEASLIGVSIALTVEVWRQ